MQTHPEEEIGRWLIQKKLYLVTAESCTGGLIGDRVTNVPGSSDYYLGGVVTYSNQTKIDLLGVHEPTLQKYGAVSCEIVLEMAQGVRRLFASPSHGHETVGLSISGVAGPAGGTKEKPVGLAWIGLSAPDGDWAWKIMGTGDRLANKTFSADQALHYLLAVLSGKKPSPTLDVFTRSSPKGEEIPTRLIWNGEVFEIADIGRHWHDELGEHWLVMNPSAKTARLTRLPTGAWSLSSIAPGRKPA
jgi:PncC family amidohydrolase